MGKPTKPEHCLQIDLLRFLRDNHPTEAEFLDRQGPSRNCYYALKSTGLIIDVDGRLHLSPDHLAKDGQSFRYRHMIIWLDLERIDWIRYEPANNNRE